MKKIMSVEDAKNKSNENKQKPTKTQTNQRPLSCSQAKL